MRTKTEIAESFDSVDCLSEETRFFLVGIGGAGMSAVAKILIHDGYQVRGVDLAETALTSSLRALGAEVQTGLQPFGLLQGEVLVLSDAIELGTSMDVKRARDLGAPILRRSQVLGWLLRGKKVIGVTGTHGKTTTTSMLSLGLIEAAADPTCVIGADVPQLNGSFVAGKGDWAVVEACEAYNSFLDLQPELVVVLNLELDHIDFHKDYDSLLNSVVEFCDRVPATGCVCLNRDDPGCRDVSLRTKSRVVWFDRENVVDAHLAVPGQHNRVNASAALAVARESGADAELTLKGIERFMGAERRLQQVADRCFDRVGGNVTIYDDYAHHPTEIAASLQALREKHPGRRIVVVYQPHLYSRTQGQEDAFAQSLGIADFVVLTDIYPARERPIPGVSSFLIVEKLNRPTRYIPSRHLLARKVAPLLEPGDVVVGMGAGNISEFVPQLLEELERSRVKHVAVIYGGDSAEREVSIHSSLAVEAALEPKYKVNRVDVSDLLLSKGDLSFFTGSDRPDVAILAVHGTHAEDGAIQGFLELAGIPYTGSGILASAVAMDKAATKLKLTSEGLPVPSGQVVRRGLPLPTFPGPCVVKPNAQGSTVGLSFVQEEAAFLGAVERALCFDEAVLVEEWVQGREVTVPVIGDQAFDVIEISPEVGGYDFANKYVPGKTKKTCPAEFSQQITEKLKDFALRSHKALGCRGVTRTDMIVSPDRIVILEVNTLPGMTGTSLVAMSAKVGGMDFPTLLDWMISDAIKHYEKT